MSQLINSDQFITIDMQVLDGGRYRLTAVDINTGETLGTTIVESMPHDAESAAPWLRDLQIWLAQCQPPVGD